MSDSSGKADKADKPAKTMAGGPAAMATAVTGVAHLPERQTTYNASDL